MAVHALNLRGHTSWFKSALIREVRRLGFPFCILDGEEGLIGQVNCNNAQVEEFITYTLGRNPEATIAFNGKESDEYLAELGEAIIFFEDSFEVLKDSLAAVLSCDID